jgi:hypothetical protein
MDTINTELLLADIDLIKNILEKKKTKDEYSKEDQKFLRNLCNHINNGNNIRSFKDIEKHKKCIQNLHLLTIKPVLYVANVKDKDDISKIIKKIKNNISNENCDLISIPIDPKIEPYRNSNILDQLINRTYEMLNLITFYSVGKKEIKAWSIEKGSSALTAANKIHSDIERGFIKAEVISYNDFIKFKGENKAKIAGKFRLEGKKYIVQNGDIINFKFNV